MRRSGAGSRRAAVLLAGVIGAWGGCAGVLAQVEIPFGPPPQADTRPVVVPAGPGAGTSAPATQRGPVIPSVDSVMQGLLQENSTPRGPLPATARGTSTRPGEPLELREGQYIDLLPGYLKKDGATGAMMFVFSAEGSKEPPYPPMRAVPSRRLAAMEDASEFGQSGMMFRIVAEITQYRGKNYLYIRPVDIRTNGPGVSAPSAGSGGVAARGVAATMPTSQPAAGPGILEVRPVAPIVPAGTSLREGQPISNRVGRLVRDATSGTEMFVFDSDGKQMYDPPMGVIPCHNLELIEDATGHGEKEVKFRVSGEVTQYRGKNYLYLKFVKAVKDLNQGLGG